ncbi:aminotransferase-like domain-containing protein [Paenibacillus radicis (ex Gao et al. 2016)]|uniref:2-aminoadipate aminotransferase n=1 Tax=Paenibacillus radicis (ex Gao et al. 2016) TaxID=1737354 RepID=A0A917HEF7_9BACL|nr:PLP-dependent aminotransferase family protein [Paenibacillus radicis (ex Gao et al. 2016)]GGG75310.1 2-aminoadipate aminotransferase [Paenibacillus radicis (ex Gao et al. 2016)]
MDYRFASRIAEVKSSAVRDILKLTQGKDMISFAGGLPAEELFPVQAVREAAERVFDAGKGALQYGLTEGYLPLREQLCVRMAQKGMNVDPDEIILTTGSQQAISLLVQVLTEPGDVILVEKPTYLACLQVFELYGLRVIAAESDEHGIIPEDAERLIREHKPKMLYAVPTFGNPTGNVWSLERRQQLLDLCVRNGIPILEDDPYGEIKFDETADYPTLFSLDQQQQGGAVIYTSTFSKTVAPALRTGWAIGNAKVIRMMAKAKQAADIHSSTMDQQILSQLLAHFPLDDHIQTIRRSYRDRMVEMQSLLLEQKIEGFSWIEPKGGMFIWTQLPEGLDAEVLLKAAVLKGVAFVPGSSFYAYDPQRNTARLNFTHNTGQKTVQGVERLADAIREFTARS